MKSTKTIIILALIALVPALMGSENGVAEDQNKDRTGAPGSQSPCSASTCHDDGSFNPTLTIEVLELGSNMSVSSYIPEETYQMKFTIEAGVGNPSCYGFQATALLSDNSNAGTFSNPGDLVQLESVGQRHIVEHSDPNPSNFFVVDWQAPATGAGDVTVYASSIACNGSGTDGGDGYDGDQLTISELSTSVDDLNKDSFSIQTFTSSSLNVTSDQNAQLRCYDSSGRVITNTRIQPGQNIIDPKIQHPGIILIEIVSENSSYSGKFVVN